MPFNSNLKAKTNPDTSGLACFIPSVAALFLNEGSHEVEKDSLASAFKNYYGISTSFSRNDLKSIIQNTQNLNELTTLLKPVLRRRMVDRMRSANSAIDPFKPTEAYIAKISDENAPLTAADLLYLANGLGIPLEVYDPQNNHVDVLRDRKKNLSAFPIKPHVGMHTLKMRNENEHWGFNRVWSKDAAENKQMLDDHNAQCDADLRHFNAEALRTRVKVEVEKGHTCLSPIFAEPDVIIKPASPDPFGSLASAFKNTFSGITSALKNTFGGISSKLGNVMGSMFGNSNSTKNALGDTFGGITSTVGNLMKNMFSGLSNKSGQEDIFTSLFKMLGNLLQSLIGFFGQSNPKTVQPKTPQPGIKKSTPAPTVTAVGSAGRPAGSAGTVPGLPQAATTTRSSDMDQRRPQVGTELAEKFRKLFEEINSLPTVGEQPAQASPGQAVHLSQFERTRAASAKAMRDAATAASKPDAALKVSY